MSVREYIRCSTSYYIVDTRPSILAPLYDDDRPSSRQICGLARVTDFGADADSGGHDPVACKKVWAL